MTGDRGNDRDNRKIVGLGWLRKNIITTTSASLFSVAITGNSFYNCFICLI